MDFDWLKAIGSFLADIPRFLNSASPIINTVVGIAGVVGLFVAVQAYRVAKRQELLAKELARKTFELEILRELLVLLDRLTYKIDQEVQDGKHGGEFANVELGPDVMSRLILVSEEDLPTWHRVADEQNVETILEFILEKHPQFSERVGEPVDDAGRSVRIFNALYQEVAYAMANRMKS